MAAESLIKRVETLEAEVARLKRRLEEGEKPAGDWLDKAWGAFANDPVYDEAMRLGRKYRESLRPKTKKPKKS